MALSPRVEALLAIVDAQEARLERAEQSPQFAHFLAASDGAEQIIAQIREGWQTFRNTAPYLSDPEVIESYAQSFEQIDASLEQLEQVLAQIRANRILN
ncbi:hypothetical protein Mterra_03056 [Calidithermus terrae]|uniref:Uncharacterized protein n=1 Tax=Calidithermus terrae TaxID=1408545 RepID=A0A399EDL0_9DEIN|nr:MULTISPECIES: hypothetical protein [Calidithermus]RIH81623.1 hypothetical protein Mterra_03056 [Calidithermus terrae]